jgi:hypothetical protein
VNDRDLPGQLKRELDKQPLRVICEYLCGRLEQTQGPRELRITFVDGRYDRGTAGPTPVPFAKLQESVAKLQH